MPLITTLAAALGLALVLGFLATRLRLPALVGYLVAGVVIGPFTPGYVADVDLALQLAEIGVMLLMFGVGLHFSVDDLLGVRRLAVPGAIVQMVVATVLGWGLALSWGWGQSAALVFGLSLSVASTVVLLRALEAKGLLESPNGKIAVGWLVVEDLAMVLVLVLLPAVAAVAEGDSRSVLAVLGQTLLAVVAFVALMLMGGRRFLPWLLWKVSTTGSRELFTLSVMVAAISIAYGASALFGVSVALGAFFAGLVLRESEFSARAAEESLPFRDAFAVLFFVSVGMLFDPRILIDAPVKVLATALVIMVGKSIAAAALVMLLRRPLSAALTIAASLAQIGEFSFILATLGGTLGLLPAEAKSLIVAGALISIALNPVLFAAVEPLRQWILARSPGARAAELRDDPLAELPRDTDVRFLQKQVVLVGHGSVGSAVARALRAQQMPMVVVDHQRHRVEALRRQGVQAVVGDAVDPTVLVQAHVATASLVVITVSDPTAVRPIMDIAQRLNPGVPVVVRAHTAEEAALLEQDGALRAYHPQEALAEVLTADVLRRVASAQAAR